MQKLKSVSVVAADEPRQSPPEALNPATIPDNINWQAECNRLNNIIFGLRRELHNAKHPARTAEQSERELYAVRQFVDSMGATEASVTCANIYNEAWFKQDGDVAYGRLLCRYLTSRFDVNYALIETTYAQWRERGA